MRNKIFLYMCMVSALAALLSGAGTAAIYVFMPRGGLAEREAGALLPWLAVICVTVSVAGFLLSAYLSKRVVSPLGSNDVGYVELLPLIHRMEKQKTQLRHSVSVLEERESSLAAIMECMTEGLVILDSKAVIVGINRAAITLLQAPPGDYAGRDIFVLSRDPLLQAAVYQAIGGGGSEELLALGGGTVQLAANPVMVDGLVRGVVLFMLDVTEKQEAEQMRREFSANVSHELKTPLTSISGYAEIIRDGLVKPGDIPRFAASIYDEAARLLTLIEDILRLSSLDEGGANLVLEEVGLLSLSRAVLKRLLPTAERYGVSVEAAGTEAALRGSRPLLDEMIYNLCDNAIKYNKPGGSVTVTVSEERACVLLTVSDSGIGIAREHQGRVFERFYRVDKSHSKKTGGTGLGLSIVKHGAIYHKAQIELVSVPDEGTTVRLRFPA